MCQKKIITVDVEGQIKKMPSYTECSDSSCPIKQLKEKFTRSLNMQRKMSTNLLRKTVSSLN